jgi:hypothetical protein
MDRTTPNFTQIDEHVAVKGGDIDISGQLIKKYQATYLGAPFNMYLVPNITVEELKTGIYGQAPQILTHKSEKENGPKKAINKIIEKNGPIETGYYDTNNIPMKVGDLIRFNPAASYHRDTTQYGQIKGISTTGTLYFYPVPIIEEIIRNDPSGNDTKIKPDLTANITQKPVYSMSLKRGKHAANGYYRYEGSDVSIIVVTLNDEYIRTICWS